jgi:hypothetical protein
MGKAIGNVIGSVLGIVIFGGALTGISILLHKLAGKRLSRAQLISTFVVSCLVCIALVIYERCSA